MSESPIHALLIISGSGPMLILTSYPGPGDPRLVEQLRWRGISRFLAYEIAIDTVRERYPDAFARVAQDLAETEDARVLDYNGHQIMAKFRHSELGQPLGIGEGG
ncbi:MAG TPA: hypothetical protein VMT85_24135 [Thermoanaerobaculia bacterium]|nr:hypothetical protein [Thermoanaerobaculia bacterium]